MGGIDMFDKSQLEPYEAKMKKSIKVLEDELSGMRAGRANPSILNKISIDYYGVPTPITQIGSVSVPEARLIVFQPWDTSVLKDVERAIQISDIGINPNNDGKVIRLVFPPLTEERRKELVKQVKKHGEETKVAIRSIRRDAIDYFKSLKKDSVITEDDLKDAEKEIQKLTDKMTAEVDNLVVLKEEDIMAI
jgi:ribosome recycling factor